MDAGFECLTVEMEKMVTVKYVDFFYSMVTKIHVYGTNKHMYIISILPTGSVQNSILHLQAFTCNNHHAHLSRFHFLKT